MACWTRAWRPAGWGRTASSAESTSLAEAAMALGSSAAACFTLSDTIWDPRFGRF
jgi:hypothetical protein